MLVKKEVWGKTAVLFSFLLLSATLGAQEKGDDFSSKVLRDVRKKFPSTRVLNISYNQSTPYHYTPELHDNELSEGKVKNARQLRMSANMVFVKKPKWMLGTTLNYRYASMKVEHPDWATGELQRQQKEFHYHLTSLNFSYFSKLFDKRTIYSASMSVDGSQHHFEKFRGMATATMILKATPKTRMSVGLILLLDPNIPTPIFFSFSYEHLFENGWVADVTLPKEVFLRKSLSKNDRISIGSELDNTSFYLYHLEDTDKTYSFSRLAINSGLVYEHYLGHSFIVTAKTGIRATPMSRIAEKTKPTRDYIFKASPKPSFYLNVGVSFNPFQ